eukprot:224129_1
MAIVTLNQGILRNIVYFTIVILLWIRSSDSELKQCKLYGKKLPIPLGSYQMVHFPETNVIYIFGGGTTVSSCSSKIFKWNISSSHQWFQRINTTTTACFYSFGNNVVRIDDKAYFIGMNDGSYDSGAIYIFNSFTESFEKAHNLSKPEHPAIYGCLSTNTTHIFMVGGDRNNTSLINYLQIYDIKRDKWSSMAINVGIIKNGYTNQYCEMIENTLFVFGGSTDKRIKQYYKWRNDKWTYLGNRSTGLDSGGTAFYQPNIYIIGGYTGQPTDTDHTSYSNVIDVFNINNGTIISTYYLVYAVCRVSPFFINNTLYVIGGWNGPYPQQYTSSVQVCDLENPSINPTANPPILTPITIVVITGVILLIVVLMIICIKTIKQNHADRDRNYFLMDDATNSDREMSAIHGK